MILLAEHKISTSIPQSPLSQDANSINRQSPVLIRSLPVFSDSHSPSDLAVRLLSWVPGRPMSSVKLLPMEALAGAGRFLGRMDNILDRLNPLDPNVYGNVESLLEGRLDASLCTAANRYHQWDGKNTADLRIFVQHIGDEKRRNLVVSVLDAFQRELLESGASAQFRTGVNHGDFNDANIMVDQDFSLTGVIDFGDSTKR